MGTSNVSSMVFTKAGLHTHRTIQSKSTSSILKIPMM